MLIEFDEDFMGLAAVSLRSSLKYRRNWNKNGPTVQLLRKYMPRGSKGFRVYVPIGKNASIQNILPPLPVRLAVKQAGFRITNYLAKKCVKLSDKEQKNEFNIGKVIAKDPVAKAAFDNDPQLQNSNHSEFTMVISCHPYDIIGMSTGRSWDDESCMRLRDYRPDYRDGINTHYLERDVAEGTLVAYVIRSDDTNIEKPLGRCLLKPFVDESNENILYRRETKIYGNPVPGFSDTLNRFIRKLNAGIPAGLYRMKAGLYNDGVGGRHEQEESGAEHENRVDWTVVDDVAKLKERPDLFPSFVEYMMKNAASGLTEPRNALSVILKSSAGVPARYIKMAARLLATSEDFSESVLEKILYPEIATDYLPTFLKSKELRKAVNARRTGNEYTEESPQISMLSSTDAHEYFMSRNVDLYSTIEDAFALVYGSVKMLPSDIQTRPLLHKMVYLLADITRAASTYGLDKQQETSHEILSTLPQIDTKLSLNELTEFSQFLSQMDYHLQAAVYMLRLVKQGNADDADIVASYQRAVGFRVILKNRRLAKLFLTMQGVNEGLARNVSYGAIQLLEVTAENELAEQRDVLNIIQKMEIFNTFSPDYYYRFLNAHAELVEKAIYSDYRGQDSDAVYHALDNLGVVETICRVFHRKPMDYQNQQQKELFEIFCTLADISDDPDSGAPKFNFEPEKIIKLIADNKRMMAKGIKRLGIDPSIDTEFLIPENAEYISIAKFLSDDNGEYYTKVAASNGLVDFCRIIGAVFDNPTYDQLVQLIAAIIKHPLRKMSSHGANIVTMLAKEERAENWAKLQTMYDDAYAMVRGAERYMDRYLDLMTPGMPEKFAAEFGFDPDDVKDNGPHIMELMNKLTSQRDVFGYALRVFPAVVDKTKIKMDTNPAYYVE